MWPPGRTLGLSLGGFSREYEVDYQRLNSWRRRLTTPPATTEATEVPMGLVELPPPLAPAAPPRYEIQLPGGEILRVEGLVDRDAVASLLALLRGARAC